MDNTKYQITKTVRFKLEPVFDETNTKVEFDKEFNPIVYSQIDLDSFSNDLKELLQKLKKFLLEYEGDSPKSIDKPNNKFVYVFKKNIEIRYDFLMAFIKKDFFAARIKEEKLKFYSVNKYGFLAQRITEVLLDIEDVNRKLSDFANLDLEEQEQRAVIAYWINRLDNRFHFHFIHELFKSLNDKLFADTSYKERLSELDSFKDEIKVMQKSYLPAQSNGLQVATSSLNYYTVEKTPKPLDSLDGSDEEGYSLINEKMKAQNANQSKIFEPLYRGFVLANDYISYVNYSKWDSIDQKISFKKGNFQIKGDVENVNIYGQCESLIQNAINKKYPFINVYSYFKNLQKSESDGQNELFINLYASQNNKDIKEVAAFFIDFESDNILDDKYRKLFPDDFGKRLHNLYTTKQSYRIDELISHFSLEETYLFLKCWRKSIVKSYFTQNVYNYLSDKDEYKDKEAIKIALKAFDLYKLSDDDLTQYIELTKQIKVISNQINDAIKNFENVDSLQKQLQNICDERNTILTNQPLYGNFCDFYMKVAIAYGKNKALIKSIEKENNTALQLNYWSFISEIDNTRYVYFIPRNSSNNYKAAKKILFDDKHKVSGKPNLFYFESLTLRALRKLCFNNINDNTFRDSLTSCKLPACEQIKKIPGQKPIPTTDFDKILMYVRVLNDGGSIKNQLNTYSKLKKKVLNIRYNRDTASFADFETKLNLYCYKVLGYCCDVDALLKNNNIPFFKFKIELPRKNNKEKDYTKLWNEFFKSGNETNDYPIRLNPEVKLFRRDANVDFGSWYDCGKSGAERKETRFEKPRYTLALTFTENADSTKVDYSFSSDTRDYGKVDRKVINIQHKIDDFTNEYKKDKNCKFALGIDVGDNECLACLTACDENGNPILIDVMEVNDDTKQGKNDIAKKNGNVAEFMHNPSYYLNKDLYDNSFDTPYSRDKYVVHKKVCSIDLTTTKVFALDNIGKNKGIVLDSDYISHLNLKKINAQVKMSECRKENPECEFVLGTFRGNTRIFALSKDVAQRYSATSSEILLDKQPSIYDFNCKYDNVKNINEIYNEIKILERQLGKENLEENINKAKNTIVANMVGVIYYVYNQLQKRFGADSYGMIVFEGLSEKEIAAHRDSNKADITLTLRNALLKKFQNDLCVPPYKEVSKLSDGLKFTIKKSKNNPKTEKDFGIVRFVNQDNTSQCCPRCKAKSSVIHPEIFDCCSITLNNWKATPNMSDEEILLYESMDINDKVAAFNIAKRAFGLF
ncbi:MAG: hypothetical protein J6Z01_08080 [Bacteroidales bacterium]|nr:hypothetical protein [Bacteroidales bacterium]